MLLVLQQLSTSVCFNFLNYLLSRIKDFVVWDGGSEGEELVGGISLPSLICCPVDAALCWDRVKAGFPHPCQAGGAGLGLARGLPSSTATARQCHGRMETPKRTRQRGRDL